MRKRPRKKLVQFSLFVCAGLMQIASCSATPPPSPVAPHDSELKSDPVLGVADTGTRCAIPAMMDLWQRRASSSVGGYPLGPGDELMITVPEIDELQNQQARISQAGTISLPLVGTVGVGGLDEDQARDVLSQHLAKFMKKPRLEMFVARYRSRGVAVAGAVQKPGVYDLAAFGDSLNDMIALAGGMASDAAQRAVFLPVGFTEYSTALAAAPTDPPDVTAKLASVRAAASDQVSGSDSSGPPRRISITVTFGHAGDAGCLNMPARPGDEIIVPTAGTVEVVGWVKSPGSFPITPGMTVLGAVTAAGGAEFSWHAEVLRTDQDGARVVKRFSFNDLKSGKETDIPVEAGDVVVMEKSVIGAVPYGLKEIFEHFGTGIGMGVPAF